MEIIVKSNSHIIYHEFDLVYSENYKKRKIEKNRQEFSKKTGNKHNKHYSSHNAFWMSSSDEIRTYT